MSRVLHPRLLPRRGARARATTWWGKAWVRATEEAAFAERDLRMARSLSRSGRIGSITVGPGEFLAAAHEGDDVWTVTGSVPTFDEPSRAALVETVAFESGRIASLLAGELPLGLVEHAEEVGVELLPYGGELDTSCSCEAWMDPCVHALAVLYQLAWLIEGDPFVLLTLRGLPREELLASLHARREAEVPDNVDLDTAVDAAARAERALELLEHPDDTDPDLDRLF